MRFRAKRKKTYRICAEHFKTRCCQRLGVVLDQEKLRKMMSDGSLRFVRKQSNTRTHWLFRVPETGKSAILVYDKPRGVFVTVLDVESQYNIPCSRQ